MTLATISNLLSERKEWGFGVLNFCSVITKSLLFTIIFGFDDFPQNLKLTGRGLRIIFYYVLQFGWKKSSLSSVCDSQFFTFYLCHVRHERPQRSGLSRYYIIVWHLQLVLIEEIELVLWISTFEEAEFHHIESSCLTSSLQESLRKDQRYVIIRCQILLVTGTRNKHCIILDWRSPFWQYPAAGLSE